jgi:tetratricopeptide (TPR) repeat protein
VPELHVAQGELEQAAVDYGLLVDADVGEPFARGVAATERALAVLPDHEGALVLQSTMYRRLAEFRGVRGQPIDDLIQHALAAVRRAVAVAPAGHESAANAELARVYWTWGDDRERRGDDPSEQLRLSIDASDRVGAGDRDDKYFLNRGLVFKTWADYQDSAGADSAANRDKAIAAFEQALALTPQSTVAMINLGANYYERAVLPRAPDPDRDLAAAAGTLDRALAINPSHTVGHFYQAKVSEQVALRGLARGADPRPELARALEHYRAAIAINPALPYLHNGVGAILLDQGTDAWNRGDDPAPLFAEARASFENAIKAAPDQWYGYNNLGESWRQLAELERDGGQDGAASARAALTVFDRALAANPTEPYLIVDRARARVVLATIVAPRGDPEPLLDEADGAFAHVLFETPTDPDATLGRALTAAARAETRAQRGQGRDADNNACLFKKN